MNKINLSLCTYSDKISVDSNDCFDDSQNGKFGYRVFYAVPKSEIDRLGVFNDLDELKDLKEDEDYCGELEFSVDENEEQYGEVLLWCSIENNESTENIDFINYIEDISGFVKDFITHQVNKE